MAWDEEEDTTTYSVVVNSKKQYAIWPQGKKKPAGWSDFGKQGQKKECIGYIDKKWPGMNPLILLK